VAGTVTTTLFVPPAAAYSGDTGDSRRDHFFTEHFFFEGFF
jgi:hypothetical protein